VDKVIEFVGDVLLVAGILIAGAVATVKPLPGKGGFTCGRVEQVGKVPAHP
jgi:hypothetical protein